MKEYIDLDTPLELLVTRGYYFTKQITTLRELLDVNKTQYKAADVREVVRGRWIKHNATHIQKGGMYLECSCCHEYITVLGHVFAYCPNCGADMRGEQDV